MAKTLKTTDALYGNITSFICVDGGALVDLKNGSRTFTKDSATTYGTGTLGENINIPLESGVDHGVTVSPPVAQLQTTQAVTVVVVLENIPSPGYYRGLLLGSTTGSFPINMIINVSGFPGPTMGYDTSKAYDATAVGSGGPHMFSVSKAPGDAQVLQLGVDGVYKTSQESGSTSDGQSFDRIGGYPGQGEFGAKYVYIVQFNKVLTQAELTRLYGSLGANGAFALLDVAADTTAPTFTGTITAGTIAPTSAVIDWSTTTRTDDVAITGFETSIDGGTVYTAAGNGTSATVSGLTANVSNTVKVRAYDAANNKSAPLSVTFTTPAVADTTPPAMTGAITQGAVTSSSIAGTYPAATDNVAVTGYEISKDGGSTWVNNGTSLSFSFTGLTASTAYAVRVRAYDNAGNRANPVLSASISTSAAATRTWTSAMTFVNVQGSGANMIGVPQAGIGFSVNVADALGNKIDRKAGLVTGSDGKPPAWTGTAGALATDYYLTYIKDSDSRAIGSEVLRCT